MQTILETDDWLGFDDCSWQVIQMWDHVLIDKVLSQIQPASIGVEF